MSRKWNSWGALLCSSLLCMAGGAAQANTFVVDSGADSGAGTLRDAIEQANLTPADDVISITLDAGAQILVDSNLPAIVEPLTFETVNPRIGLAPSGGSTATRGIAVNAGVDTVTIVGFEISGFPVGLVASGSFNLFGSVVRDSTGDGVQIASGTLGVIGREDEFSEGCAIHGNGGNGITYGDGGKLPTVLVRDSRIGISPTGELDGNAESGIEIAGTLADFEHYIFQNFISANTGAGIFINGANASRLIIGGNTIGLGADDSPAPNAGGGIVVDSSTGVLIGDAGGDLFGRDPNRISSNTGFGVQFTGSSSACSLARNGIAANTGAGVVLAGSANGNIIIANTFQQNTGTAIEVAGESCLGNDFSSNVFDENADLITLVAGAHDDLLPPTIVSESDRVSAVNLGFGQSVEWYFDDGAGSLYPVGIGLNLLYLEDLSAYFGGSVRALVTDLDDGTSEFSETLEVSPPSEVLEDACDDAISYDDDTPSSLLSLPEEAGLGGFVMLFEPPTPFHVQRVCVNLQAAVDGPFLGAVAVYVNNNGTPGGLIRRVPFGLQLSTTATRYSIDVSSPRISFDTGSVFVGILYDQDAYPGVAITADSGEGVTPRPLFRSSDAGSSWDPFDSIPLFFDVIGTRLLGEETGCASGIVVDDGTFEGSIGPNSIKAGFAIAATPPQYPYTFTGTCLRLHAPVQSATLSASLTVFAYDGSFSGDQPVLGTQLASIPLEAVPLTNAASWYYFDFGESDITLTEGSAFFRLDWVSTTINGDNEQLFYNNTNGSDAQEAYVRAANDGSFVPMTVLFPTFRSFGWRIDGAVPVAEGEGVVEGIVEGGTEGIVEGTLEGEGGTEGGTEGEGEAPVPNSADYDGNFVVSLSELIRLVQLYNAGSFGCDEGTEDGFAPNSGIQSCTPHSADYVDQDWSISLSELLRIVQLYSLEGYTVCGESEDGFCAV
jgi:parallel beta-helix repeat protein